MMKSSNEEKWQRQMLLHIIVVFILSCVLSFLVDGYLLHPIPLTGEYAEKEIFDLSKTETEYADAHILWDSNAGDGIYYAMVEKEGQIHLLYFTAHRYTGRRALVDDVIIEPGMTGTVRMGGNTLLGASLVLENGEVVNVVGGAYYYARYREMYGFVALLITIPETILFGILTRRKYTKENDGDGE